MSRYNRYIITTIVVCLVIFTHSATAGTQELMVSQQSEVVTGVSIPINDVRERDLMTVMETLSDIHPVDSKEHAFFVMNNNSTWLVFADNEPAVGEIRVEGRVFNSNTENPVIFASTFSVSQSGPTITPTRFRNNTEEYLYEHVNISGNLRQISYVTDAGEGEFQIRTTVGSIGTDQYYRSFRYLPPGRGARWAVLNLSDNSISGNRSDLIAEQTLNSGNYVIGGRFGQQRWWVQANATVGAVVIDRATGAPGDEKRSASLYFSDISLQSERLSGVNELHRRGQELEGQIVSFQARRVGAELSAKRTLLSIARCAPDSVLVPSACVPVVTDTSIHFGVFFNDIPSSRDDVVYYVGLANKRLDVQSKTVTGKVAVTGRVVNTDRIDPRLPDGLAIVIYDVSRIGTIQGEDFGADVRNRVNKLHGRLRSQLNLSESKWSDELQQRETTPTQTDTPTTDTRSQSTTTTVVTKTPRETPTDTVAATGQIQSNSDGSGDSEVFQSILVGFAWLMLLLGIFLVFTSCYLENMRYKKAKEDPQDLSLQRWHIHVTITVGGLLSTLPHQFVNVSHVVPLLLSVFAALVTILWLLVWSLIFFTRQLIRIHRDIYESI